MKWIFKLNLNSFYMKLKADPIGKRAMTLSVLGKPLLARDGPVRAICQNLANGRWINFSTTLLRYSISPNKIFLLVRTVEVCKYTLYSNVAGLDWDACGVVSIGHVFGHIPLARNRSLGWLALRTARTLPPSATRDARFLSSRTVPPALFSALYVHSWLAHFFKL